MHGHRIGVVETQGPWSFVACERFMNAVDEIQWEFLVVETSRVGLWTRPPGFSCRSSCGTPVRQGER
jgi:hypothetical protein